MKADKIIKNAKIYTADKDKPLATALVVKDGKFAYVGDEAGISEYAGEVGFGDSNAFVNIFLKPLFPGCTFLLSFPLNIFFAFSAAGLYDGKTMFFA